MTESVWWEADLSQWDANSKQTLLNHCFGGHTYSFIEYLFACLPGPAPAPEAAAVNGQRCLLAAQKN